MAKQISLVEWFLLHGPFDHGRMALAVYRVRPNNGYRTTERIEIDGPIWGVTS